MDESPNGFRALVVDYAGVLTTSLGDSFAAFCRREGADEEAIREALRKAYGDLEPDSLIARFEKGLVERTEFEVHLAELLSAELDEPLDPRDLIARMLADVRPDEEMIEAVRAARAHGFRTALLSNSWGVDYYPRDLLAELFEEVLISGEVGMRKPDPEAFELAAGRLDLAPADCVFVDDHDVNVEAARKAGMYGVLHERSAETVGELERLLGVPLASPGGVDSIDTR